MQQKGVHWFPGHMQKALKEIKERLKVIDVIVEIVDSRIPLSSKNRFLEEATINKSRVLVFSKKDLCDLNRLKEWEEYYQNLDYRVVTADLNEPKDIKKILQSIALAGQNRIDKYLKRGMKPQALRIMILGIPNVGKSTLINRIAGKNKASAANTPGHTKAQQWIKISDRLELLDTPGILPPIYQNKEEGINLALTGAMKEQILPKSSLCEELIKFLKENYAKEFESRYELENIKNLEINEIIEGVAKTRHLLSTNERPDLERAESLILKEFKEGKIAKVVMEKC